MIFFLDFDRTLLDWDGLIMRLVELCPPLRADISAVASLPPGTPEREAVWKKVAELIQGGAFSIHEQDVQKYIYKDALKFVTGHVGNIVIMTSGDPSLQKIKINLAFPEMSFQDILLCGGHNHKGVEIREWLNGRTSESIFVDDAPLQLESVARECPHVRLFEICRDCEAPASRFPWVRDFNELEEQIKNQ